MTSSPAHGARDVALNHVYTDREAARLTVALWPLDVDEELRRLDLPTFADAVVPPCASGAERAFSAALHAVGLATARVESRLALCYLRDAVGTPGALAEAAAVCARTEVRWAADRLRIWHLVGQYFLRRLAPLPSHDPQAGVTLSPEALYDAPPAVERLTFVASLFDRVREDTSDRGEAGLADVLDRPETAPARTVPPTVPSWAALTAALLPLGGVAPLVTDVLAGWLGHGVLPLIPPGAGAPEMERVLAADAADAAQSPRDLPTSALLARHNVLAGAVARYRAHERAVRTRRTAVAEALLGRWIFEHAAALNQIPALRAAVLTDLAALGDREGVEAFGAATQDRGATKGWIFAERSETEQAAPARLPGLAELPTIVFQQLVHGVLMPALRFQVAVIEPAAPRRPRAVPEELGPTVGGIPLPRPRPVQTVVGSGDPDFPDADPDGPPFEVTLDE